MSEPASLLVQCNITADGLRRCLAADEPRLLAWSDWDNLDIIFGPNELADIDGRGAQPTGAGLQELRDWAEVPADWLFRFDEATERLTIGQVLFTDEWGAIVATLAELRRLGNYIDPGLAPGMIWVHDWVFGHQGTMAAVSLFPGGSTILTPDDVARDGDTGVEAIFDDVLGPVREAVDEERDEPIRDDLGAFFAGPDEAAGDAE